MVDGSIDVESGKMKKCVVGSLNGRRMGIAYSDIASMNMRQITMGCITIWV